MFIKKIIKTHKKIKKRYYYYRLCESYRIGGNPRHRTILNLGDLSKLPNKEDHKVLSDRIEEIVRGELPIFKSDNPIVDKLAEDYASILINQRLIDIPCKEGSHRVKEPFSQSDYHTVDVNSLTHKQIREIGAEWLCKQTIEMLGLEEYLGTLGWKRIWIIRAMIYLIAKAVFPASERKTADWLKRNSGLCELYNIHPRKVNRYHLYKVSRMLYKEKGGIESYLSKITGELFSTDDKILIYDLTNSYFEGEKAGSEKARYGRSKEKRKDAKLLSLAMVVDRDGFVRYSRIYEGNIRDSKTLKKTIEEMSSSCQRSNGKRVIVMDAGVATEENLAMLREGYEYVCVSLSKPSVDEQLVVDLESVKLKDKKGNSIFVKWVSVEGSEDSFLYVKSEMKEKKEKGIEDLHCKRYEEGLKEVQEGIGKKGGIKKAERVYERLGRLKERYPSVHRFYDIDIKSKDNIVVELSWKKTFDGREKQGVYFIRTTFKDKDEKTVWDIYNTIRKIEATFRILKSDLKVRPIFHQEDFFSEAHIYGSVLAYTIVNSIRHSLKLQGINGDWSNIIRIMNTQKIVTTSMKVKSGHIIYVKKCSEPEKDVKEIYHFLDYKDRPFWQKKSVLPENEKLNDEMLDTG